MTAATSDAERWQPDTLVHGWQALTIGCRDDDEGAVVATLVRRRPDGVTRSVAVLYVHGYNDYVFQSHLAEALCSAGIEFYGLDLRKCGRSLRDGQTPAYCEDLHVYAEELGAAARVIRGELGHDRLVVMGHSTGGLVTSLWTHSLRGREVVDALVLNSPWFDLDAGWFERVVATMALDAVAPYAPMRVISGGPSEYSRRLHVDGGGEWSYDRRLKPWTGFPVRAGWLRAVRRGQARLSRGLAIDCPVLVCCSDASGANDAANPDLGRVDAVLDVTQIVARAPLLGPDVTVVRIPGGIHDLALSAEPARGRYLTEVVTWLADHGLAGGTPVDGGPGGLFSRPVAAPRDRPVGRPR